MGDDCKNEAHMRIIGAWPLDEESTTTTSGERSVAKSTIREVDLDETTLSDDRLPANSPDDELPASPADGDNYVTSQSTRQWGSPDSFCGVFEVPDEG